jgi:hypothetical protein
LLFILFLQDEAMDDFRKALMESFSGMAQAAEQGDEVVPDGADTEMVEGKKKKKKSRNCLRAFRIVHEVHVY